MVPGTEGRPAAESSLAVSGRRFGGWGDTCDSGFENAWAQHVHETVGPAGSR